MVRIEGIIGNKPTGRGPYQRPVVGQWGGGPAHRPTGRILDTSKTFRISEPYLIHTGLEQQLNTPAAKKTQREIAIEVLKWIIAGAITTLPGGVGVSAARLAPSGTVREAIGRLAYYATGAGIHHGKWTYGRYALASWFVLPEPLGFGSPKIIGQRHGWSEPFTAHTLGVEVPKYLLTNAPAAIKDWVNVLSEYQRISDAERARLPLWLRAYLAGAEDSDVGRALRGIVASRGDP
jgi:hypothetical protein